jgi:hypothetical protein
MGADLRAVMTCIVAWPLTLRRVRAWLDPWTSLSRWWRALSTAPHLRRSKLSSTPSPPGVRSTSISWSNKLPLGEKFGDQ